MPAVSGALETHCSFLDRFADDVLAGDMDAALQRMRAYLAGITQTIEDWVIVRVK